jgi:hypothetical protein
MIAVVAILAGAQCKKHSALVPDNPYGLPNVNEPGTEGALINGQPWIASASALAALNPNEPVAFTYGDTVFAVNGQDTGYLYSSITIKVATQGPGFGVGVPIPFNGYNTAALLSYFTDSSCYGVGGINLVNGMAMSGSITITKLDTVHHEFAGTFSSSVPLPPCDTIQITDGRFDQYYINY